MIVANLLVLTGNRNTEGGKMIRCVDLHFVYKHSLYFETPAMLPERLRPMHYPKHSRLCFGSPGIPLSLPLSFPIFALLGTGV
jgi:hypothetical protein